MAPSASNLATVFDKHSEELLTEWMDRQMTAGGATARMSESELRTQAREFIKHMRTAMQKGALNDTSGPEWAPMREMLKSISHSRALQGFKPTETATFVFSLKQPLFSRLRTELDKNPRALADELWTATTLLDQLGLYTTEVCTETRDAVIKRQQEEMLELSTPVVQLWKGILALPLIGTLDSARTQVVMETLLQSIVDTGSSIAIIDITGVPTVDTLVAQHLLKTVAAARLMGADCVISGIRPQIAQTIVHLGIDLTGVITRSTLADAFIVALERIGSSVELHGKA